MPAEPDNKMDKLLKSYASKRRDEAGVPFEMHPATRRLLQEEVTKLRPKQKAERPSQFSILLMLWPRFAAAAAILIASGVGIWLMTRFEVGRPTAMAKREVTAPEDRKLQREWERDQPQTGSTEGEVRKDKLILAERLRETPSPASLPPAKAETFVRQSSDKAASQDLEKAKDSERGVRLSLAGQETDQQRSLRWKSGETSQTTPAPVQPSRPESGAGPSGPASQPAAESRYVLLQRSSASTARVVNAVIWAEDSLARQTNAAAVNGIAIAPNAEIDGYLANSLARQSVNRTDAQERLSRLALTDSTLDDNRMLFSYDGSGPASLSANGIASQQTRWGFQTLAGGGGTDQFGLGVSISPGAASTNLVLSSLLQIDWALKTSGGERGQRAGSIYAPQLSESKIASGEAAKQSSVPAQAVADTARITVSTERVLNAPQDQPRSGDQAPKPALASAKSESYFPNQPAAGGLVSSRPVLSQRFRQTEPAVAPLAEQEKVMSALLNHFELQQSGEQVRVVDSDGSVYEGRILPTAAATGIQADASEFLARTTPLLKDREDRKNQNSKAGYSETSRAVGHSMVPFRVYGTNRTLRQPALIEGTLVAEEIADPNVGTRVPAANLSGDKPALRARPLQTPTPERAVEPATKLPSTGATNVLSFQRIVGKIRIGATNEFPLNAVRTGN